MSDESKTVTVYTPAEQPSHEPISVIVHVLQREPEEPREVIVLTEPAGYGQNITHTLTNQMEEAAEQRRKYCYPKFAQRTDFSLNTEADGQLVSTEAAEAEAETAQPIATEPAHWLDCWL